MRIALTLILLSFMTSALRAGSVVQTGDMEEGKHVIQVNLIQLLSNPASFRNKKVRFTAYVVRSGADTFLFNSKDDKDNFRLDSALMGYFTDKIDLGMYLEYMDGKLLTVEGVFSLRDPDSAPTVAGLIFISYLRYQ